MFPTQGYEKITYFPYVFKETISDLNIIFYINVGLPDRMSTSTGRSDRAGHRAVGAWGQKGDRPPKFCRSVNPIPTRGADYAHNITTRPLHPPDFQTFLRPWGIEVGLKPGTQ